MFFLKCFLFFFHGCNIILTSVSILIFDAFFCYLHWSFFLQVTFFFSVCLFCSVPYIWETLSKWLIILGRSHLAVRPHIWSSEQRAFYALIIIVVWFLNTVMIKVCMQYILTNPIYLSSLVLRISKVFFFFPLLYKQWGIHILNAHLII